MQFEEKLLWILDHKNEPFDEEKYQINIDFVHSLGKKCDSVGWSMLHMNESDVENVLDKIQDFCVKNGWQARGCYTRNYPNITSDWFELKTTSFKDSTVVDSIRVATETGSEMFLDIIRAYHELSHSPKEWHEICVPERFRNACIKSNITDIDFCWIKDKGKYESEQYFYIYPNNLIPHIVCDKGLNKNDASKIEALGGYLPKIASIFHELQEINLPDCYLSEDMPSGGIAYAYSSSTDEYCGKNKILIHKDTAEILIKEKGLSWNDLTAVCIFDKLPKGYTLVKTQVKEKPANKYIEQSLIEYQKVKKLNRPARIISEKDGLKLFRKTKSEHKEDFEKKISKDYIECISNSDYKPLLPYYQVANGGQLSDEYELLSYDSSVTLNEEFFIELEKEELLKNKPKGIVFASCADGDAVLLADDGKVLRFSHEVPEVINEWPSVSQFIFDAINENQ